jgi:hypothetical protein
MSIPARRLIVKCLVKPQVPPCPSGPASSRSHHGDGFHATQALSASPMPWRASIPTPIGNGTDNCHRTLLSWQQKCLRTWRCDSPITLFEVTPVQPVATRWMCCCTEWRFNLQAASKWSVFRHCCGRASQVVENGFCLQRGCSSSALPTDKRNPQQSSFQEIEGTAALRQWGTSGNIIEMCLSRSQKVRKSLFLFHQKQPGATPNPR